MSQILRRLTTRLVLGVLLAVLPITAVLAVAIVRNASDALEDSEREAHVQAARTAADRTDAWVVERRSDVNTLAVDLAGLDRGDFEGVRDPAEGFEQAQLLDPDGERIVGSAGSPPLIRPGNPLFVQAAGGEAAIGEPVLADGTIRTLVVEPVTDVGDVTEVLGVLVVDLDETPLAASSPTRRSARRGARTSATARAGSSGRAPSGSPAPRRRWPSGAPSARARRPRRCSSRSPAPPARASTPTSGGSRSSAATRR